MAYYRGDYYLPARYYRGDYYRGRGRGDPFWGALWTGIKAVGGALLGVRPAAATTPPTVPISQTSIAGASGGLSGVSQALQAGSLQQAMTAEAERLRAKYKFGRFGEYQGPVEQPALMPSHLVGGRRRRRMNPANVRALRRSIRRVVGFGRLARSARSSVSKAATAMQCYRGGRGKTRFTSRRK